MSDTVTLVLVPGSLCNQQLFAPQIEFLNSRVNIQVADFSDCDTIAAMAAKVLGQVEGEFALLGLSMGGIISFEIMRKAPHRVTHLALLNTNPRAEIAERLSIRQQQIDEVTAGGTAALLKITEELLFPNYLAPGCGDCEQIKAVILAMAEEVGPTQFIHQWRALSTRIDSRPRLSEIGCPTLLLTGEHDGICSPERYREMAAAIPHSRLQIVADCGHISTLEQPHIINRAIADWLALSRQ